MVAVVVQAILSNLGKTDKIAQKYLEKTDKCVCFCLEKTDKCIMKRRIFNDLDSHFRNNKSALLITGARQIGKTYSIRQFGKEKFDCFVEINFFDMPEAVELFKSARNSQELLLRISLLAKTTLKPGRTLIFLDEVQECKEIVTAIKFLVDEGSSRRISRLSEIDFDIFATKIV